MHTKLTKRTAPRRTVMLALLLFSGPAVWVGWSQNVGGLVEPGAVTWKTWVLSSGSELRISTPPEWAQTVAELDTLRALAGQRNAATLDRISYWDTGAPGQRWNEIALVQASAVRAPRGLRAMALLNVAIYDATIAAWDSKYAHNRPRPSELDPSIAAVLPNPRSPSYPSEHAVVAAAASTVLSYLFPDSAQSYAAMAREAAQSRLDAGVHRGDAGTQGVLPLLDLEAPRRSSCRSVAPDGWQYHITSRGRRPAW